MKLTTIRELFKNREAYLDKEVTVVITLQERRVNKKQQF